MNYSHKVVYIATLVIGVIGTIGVNSVYNLFYINFVLFLYNLCLINYSCKKMF